MNINLSFNKNIIILSLAGLLIANTSIYAQDNTELEEKNTDNTEITENAIIDNICDSMSKEGGDPKYGPQSFRVITLKATNKKIYVPLWYNEHFTKPEDNPDPFRPKIRKEIVVPLPTKTPTDQKRKEDEKKREEKKIIPPLKIFVKGIVGNEGVRYAVIVFENEEKTVVKNQIVDGKFKVIDIYSDRIVVYSNREERRYTFKIGEEGK